MTETFDDLLAAYREGKPGVLDLLVPYVYDDLRRLARRQTRTWPDLTLDTTGLVHEAYLKLSGQWSLRAADRAHFLAICAQAMRQYIVSYARARHAEKRGREFEVRGVEGIDVAVDNQADFLIGLDQALNQLLAVDARMVRVFECRYFAGLSEEETATALSLPLRTVQRSWARARAWVKELCG